MDERKDKDVSKLKKFIAGVFIALGILYQLLIFSFVGFIIYLIIALSLEGMP